MNSNFLILAILGLASLNQFSKAENECSNNEWSSWSACNDGLQTRIKLKITGLNCTGAKILKDIRKCNDSNDFNNNSDNVEFKPKEIDEYEYQMFGSEETRRATKRTKLPSTKTTNAYTSDQKSEELVDRALLKYYTTTQLADLKNRRVIYKIHAQNPSGTYLIGLKPEFSAKNDHKAFKEIISILNGVVLSFDDSNNVYEVSFKSKYLDVFNLNKVISIKYVESKDISATSSTNKPKNTKKTFREPFFGQFLAPKKIRKITEISSDLITNFGTWGSAQFCDYGSFVIGLRTKTESSHRNPDNTALNAIELICSDSKRITSKQGKWGSWSKSDSTCWPWRSILDSMFIRSFGGAVGFRLKVESIQSKARDQTATNAIRLVCSNRNEIISKESKWGDWGKYYYCPKDMFICGIKTQVEDEKRKDNTALNNVILYCCNI